MLTKFTNRAFCGRSSPRLSAELFAGSMYPDILLTAKLSDLSHIVDIFVVVDVRFSYNININNNN